MSDSSFNPFGSSAFPLPGGAFSIPGLENIDFSQYGGAFTNPVPSYGERMFTPSPAKPGNSFAQTAMGIGALAEGIGNVVRGIKGMDPAPPGMATSALSNYFQEKPDTSLERILDRLFTETESKFRRKKDEADEASAQPQPAA
jgi:hypothetical protein